MQKQETANNWPSVCFFKMNNPLYSIIWNEMEKAFVIIDPIDFCFNLREKIFNFYKKIRRLRMEHIYIVATISLSILCGVFLADAKFNNSKLTLFVARKLF